MLAECQFTNCPFNLVAEEGRFCDECPFAASSEYVHLNSDGEDTAGTLQETGPLDGDAADSATQIEPKNELQDNQPGETC